MIHITIAQLRWIATQAARRAAKTADDKNFSGSVAYQMSESRQLGLNIKSQLLTDDPEIGGLAPFDGMRAWGAMLAFDMRGSTKRAMKIGARGTFITMHCYLPTMLAVVKAAGGKVVGLRGDGAIAVFGHVVLEDDSPAVTPKQAAKAVSAACDCGAAMVATIDQAVNPALEETKVQAGLTMSVGIDVGEFIATNVGLERAFEHTAYGNCVNIACKRSGLGSNNVVLTNDARRMFPTSATGRTKLLRYPGEEDAYILRYPDDYRLLKQVREASA